MKGKWQRGSIKHEKTCLEQILYIDVLILCISVSFVKMVYKLLLIFSKEFTRLGQNQEDYPPVEAMVCGPGTRIGIKASGPDSPPRRGSSSAVTQGYDVSKLQPLASDVTRDRGSAGLWLQPHSRSEGRQNSVVVVHTALSHHDRQWGDAEPQVSGVRGAPEQWMLLFPHLCSASAGE